MRNINYNHDHRILFSYIQCAKDSFGDALTVWRPVYRGLKFTGKYRDKKGNITGFVRIINDSEISLSAPKRHEQEFFRPFTFDFKSCIIQAINAVILLEKIKMRKI